MNEAAIDAIAIEAEQLGGAGANGQDQAAGQGGPRVEVLPPITDEEKKLEEAKAWAGFPYLFGRLLGQAMPELKDVYSEKACTEWGGSMVPVARKYGWTPGGASMWIGLSIASWNLLEPTIASVKRKRAENVAKAHAQPASGTAAAATAGEASSSSSKQHPDGSPIVEL